ncbi:hypothetical protein BKA83DRAFT_4289423 [Pisolithus microcarpus]|nr:hypothetical protein BKA83DRAFT_4289423 [Pisolithus microcarpus]
MGIPGGFASILFEGLVSAMLLLCLLVIQTYMYFMHYSEDASATKFLVVAMWILDTLHISFICHALYHYLITNYAVPTSLEYILFVVGAVQCYFAHKIYHLCPPRLGWLVTAPIILFLLTHFDILTTTYRFANDEFDFLPKIRFSALIPCSAALVLVEVLITLSLCILLYENGSHSAFPRTKRLLNTLIIYAVNRCFLILLVALAELATLVDHHDIWAMGLDFNIGKLYVNSLLASLNTRQYLRSQISGLKPDLAFNSAHFGNLPKLPGDEETATGGKIHLEVHEVSVIDIAAVPALDKTTRL